MLSNRNADSGGHTDGRPLVSMLPALIALANRVQAQYGYAKTYTVEVDSAIVNGGVTPHKNEVSEGDTVTLPADD